MIIFVPCILILIQYTVVVRLLRSKFEFEESKWKFDQLHYVNKEPKFWGLMVYKVILGYD